MNRKKQQRNRAADHYSNGGRKRAQMTTINAMRSSVTYFEDLSNEIVYEIFDFLDMYHVYEAFSNLNIRFENLLNGSTLPVNINMSFLSKSNFERYYTQFVLPNINRISSLRLWNSFMVDLAFPSLENIEKFIGLKTVIFDNIMPQDFLNRLTSLPNLFSLIINQSDRAIKEYIYWRSIICLPALKYCKISCKRQILFGPSDDTLNKSSSIEHLVINNLYYLNELPKLLSYFPHLRRLSVICLYVSPGRTIKAFPELLNKLTHVSLTLKHTTFDQFEPFIINLFHHLQVFRISTNNDIEYLNAHRWERLISSYMTHLRIFDMQHLYPVRDDNDQLVYDDLIKKFKSSFWVERQWYFDYQHSGGIRSEYGMFYSIQPYRRRYYELYGKHNQDHHAVNDYHLVSHVHIQSGSTINDFSIFFPNANELTISDNDYGSRDSITIILDHIVPLERLNKITINCTHFHFSTLVQLLYFIPNCYQLILKSIEEADSLSAQHNATFRLIFNANKITDITVKSTCTLKQIKLLVALCPRVQHLIIKVLEKELPWIIKELLSKLNTDTRHLTSLHIQSTGDIYVEKLMNLLPLLKQPNEFDVQEIGYKNCNIWW